MKIPGDMIWQGACDPYMLKFTLEVDAENNGVVIEVESSKKIWVDIPGPYATLRARRIAEFFETIGWQLHLD